MTLIEKESPLSKTCNNCKEAKPLAEFHKYERGKYGVKAVCIICYRALRHEYTADPARKQLKQAYDLNRRHEKADEIRAKKKAAAKRDRVKLTAHLSERRKRDPYYVLSHKLLSAVNIVVKLKRSKYSKYLGCTPDEWRAWLESKFTEGMTWDNYGREGWSIDHVIPLNKFDLTKEDECHKVFHYTNTQPLWASENSHKYTN